MRTLLLIATVAAGAVLTGVASAGTSSWNSQANHVCNVWLAKANKGVPTMLRYGTHIKNNSLYNTPPSFGVYVLNLVLRWIEKGGGLPAMATRNAGKAALVSNRLFGHERTIALYTSRHADRLSSLPTLLAQCARCKKYPQNRRSML